MEITKHHFDSTREAYDDAQLNADINDGDVLIIESEEVVGLVGDFPVAVTEWTGDLHDLAAGDTLESLGFSDKSIAVARDAAKTLGFPLAEIGAEEKTVSVDDMSAALECFDNTVGARHDAEVKAWDSLGRYKFEMFGYHASAWVKYNQLLPKSHKLGNPFKNLVDEARIEKRNHERAGQ